MSEGRVTERGAVEDGETNANALTLEELEWRSRPVLVFAPAGDDSRLDRVTDSLPKLQPQIDDRDIALMVITPERVVIDGGPSRDSAADLRKRFSVSPNEFVLVLVGKDGGEKARSTDPAVLPEWFDLIDTMPMRRREMR